MAERVLTAHADGEVRATIGRASDFYGPGVTDSTVGERVFEPVLAGKTVSLLGDPDAAHTYTYIDDFARGLITLGESDEALGDAWHVPSGPPQSAREFVELVGDAAGRDPSIRRLPSWLFKIVSRFDATMAEVREMLYIFEEPFVLDHSKYEMAFGADPTPHAEAIEATVEWYRSRDE
jgi:nucleoside-diphosphate-sugar epimerase